jgi:O-glycosyl hydrolase
MLWGKNQIQEFQNIVKPGYTNCLMSYNEPNLASQANLSPQEAAQIWMDVGDPLKNQGYSTILTPAVTSAPNGVKWLQDFFNACTNCLFHAMALHIYATNSQDMIEYLTKMHNIFHMDIWVTEFACQDFTGGPQAGAEQISTFMKNVTTWMDQTSFIRKYFPYGVATQAEININPLDALEGPDGKPNALGCEALGC